MQQKCDKCGKPAAVHLTDIVNGQKIEKHLCDQCAVSEGVAIKASAPISQLLEEFILHSSGGSSGEDLKCEVCGLTFAEFRQQQVLGCPHDYDVFEPALRPLIERSHDGASQHVGKLPEKAGNAQRKQNAILRLRAALRNAIAGEDYERAAQLRDEIKTLENA